LERFGIIAPDQWCDAQGRCRRRGATTQLMAATIAARAFRCRLPLHAAARRGAARSWLWSAGAATAAAAPARSRSLSSGEEFTVYHDASCATCKSALEVLGSADAPYTTISFLKKSPKEDALLQVARVLEGGAELMLRDNSWPRVIDPVEVCQQPYHLSTATAIHR
jgi:hypothetical protein